jgi:hypothetical protein
LVGLVGDAAHDVFVFTVAVPVQSFPVQEPDAVASILADSTAFNAVMQSATLVVLT